MEVNNASCFSKTGSRTAVKHGMWQTPLFRLICYLFNVIFCLTLCWTWSELHPTPKQLKFTYCSWNPIVNEFACLFVLDENWDDDQLLGFEPCNENLITGCNIINGKCECDTIRTCNNPFEFPSQDTCLSALKRIEGKHLSSVFQS